MIAIDSRRTIKVRDRERDASDAVTGPNRVTARSRRRRSEAASWQNFDNRRLRRSAFV